MKAKTQYSKGKICGLGMVERFILKKIGDSIERECEPNSPQQIHRDARLKACKEILHKVREEMDNTYLQDLEKSK